MAHRKRRSRFDREAVMHPPGRHHPNCPVEVVALFADDISISEWGPPLKWSRFSSAGRALLLTHLRRSEHPLLHKSIVASVMTSDAHIRRERRPGHLWHDHCWHRLGSLDPSTIQEACKAIGKT
ncbi:hypothetical protein D3C87_1517610 [compost metagenome]